MMLELNTKTTKLPTKSKLQVSSTCPLDQACFKQFFWIRSSC